MEHYKKDLQEHLKYKDLDKQHTLMGADFPDEEDTEEFSSESTSSNTSKTPENPSKSATSKTATICWADRNRKRANRRRRRITAGSCA